MRVACCRWYNVSGIILIPLGGSILFVFQVLSHVAGSLSNRIPAPPAPRCIPETTIAYAPDPRTWSRQSAVSLIQTVVAVIIST